MASNIISRLTSVEYELPRLASIFIVQAALVVPAAEGKPLTGDKSLINRGQEVFEQQTCSMCHKDGGNSLDPGKAIKGSLFQKKYPDDAKLKLAIRKGFPDSGMPAFGKDKLSDKDLDAMVAYIRALNKSK